MMQCRQGDIFLERVVLDLAPEVRVVPLDAGRVVLAYGEATGHAHAFHGDHVTQHETADGTRYVTIAVAPAALLHEEHAPITVPPGLYRVRRQREWTDTDEPRVVAD